MRISTAYFAGVGTVIVAVAAGLGGGYLAANVANQPSGVSKLERRMSAEPISVAAVQPQPVPRVVATSPAITLRHRTTAARAASGGRSAVRPRGSPTNNARAEEKPVSNVAAARPVQPTLQPAKSAEQTEKKPLRLAKPSRGPATPTSNVRTRKSGAPNGASFGPKGAGSSSRVSRNSRRLKRGSGK